MNFAWHGKEWDQLGPAVFLISRVQDLDIRVVSGPNESFTDGSPFPSLYPLPRRRGHGHDRSKSLLALLLSVGSFALLGTKRTRHDRIGQRLQS